MNDKVQHVAKGALYVVAYAFLSWLETKIGLQLAALAACALGAGAYELNQKIRGQGVPSVEDWAADMIGGAAAAGVLGVVVWSLTL